MATDGPAPEQGITSPAPIEKLKQRFLGRFRRPPAAIEQKVPPPKTDVTKDISKVRAELDKTTNPPQEPVQFDERGEAVGPWSVRKSDKSSDFVLYDKRTGEPAGSYATPEEAQRFADRGNAMKALRKQIKKE